MNWQLWARGLVAALIGGGANAVTVLIIDPLDFNPFADGDAGKLLAAVVVGALVSGAMYLKQHPIPDNGVVKTGA